MKNIGKGKILTLEEVIPIKDNQTISKKLIDLCDHHILLMSLDQDTGISPEFYAEERIYFVLKGEINFNNEKLINRNKEKRSSSKKLFTEIKVLNLKY